MACGYTCSAEQAHESALAERQKAALSDRQKWLASFDGQGRYLDPETGFWESLSAEVYSHEAQRWFPAYNDESSQEP